MENRADARGDLTMKQPFEIAPPQWELFGRMLNRIAQADLHPANIGIHSTGSLFFSLPRRQIATRAQFREWQLLQRRSPWFLDTVVELIVRKALPELYLSFADVTASEFAHAASFHDIGICMSKEYFDGTVRFWIHLTRVSNIIGAELGFFACHR